jgi:ribonuclease E
MPLRERQEIIVQVDKDERGNKGAALTTFISLAGRYLVLMPNNPRGGGVSRRIEGEDRAGTERNRCPAGCPQRHERHRPYRRHWPYRRRAQLGSGLPAPACGVPSKVRGNSQQDGAFLIFQESSLVIRAIRDYFHEDIGEILIDTDSIHEQAVQFMSHVMPNYVSRAKLLSR